MFSVYVNLYNPIPGSAWANGTQETLLFTIPNQNGDIHPFLSMTVNDEMGNAGSLEFTVSPESIWYDIWRHMRTLVRVEYDGVTIFYGRVLTIDRDMFRSKRIHCEGAFTFTMDSVYEGTEKGTEMQLKEYLAALIAAHNECVTMPVPTSENEEEQPGSPEKVIQPGYLPGSYPTYLAINLTGETAPELEANAVPNDPTTYSLSLLTPDGHGTLTSNRSSTVIAGNSVTVTATPNSGYYFDYMQYNAAGVILNTQTNPYTFPMPANNVSIRAFFKANPGPSPEPQPGYNITDRLYVWEPGSNTNLFDKTTMVLDGYWLTLVDGKPKILARANYKIALIPMLGRSRLLVSTGDTQLDIPGIFGFAYDDRLTAYGYVTAASCKTSTIKHGGYVYSVNLPFSVVPEQMIKDDRQKFGANKGYKQVKEWLEELTSDYGGFMRIRYVDGTLYLDWLKTYFRPQVSDQVLSVSSNVVDLSDTVEVNNIFTHVIAVGKNTKYISGGGGGGGGGQYTITVVTRDDLGNGQTRTPGHGTITASRDRANKGGSVTMTHKSDPGWWLDRYTITYTRDGSTVTETVVGTAFTMPESDVTVTGYFKCAKYKIDEHGGIVLDES